MNELEYSLEDMFWCEQCKWHTAADVCEHPDPDTLDEW